MWWAVYDDLDDIYFENSTDGSTWANQTQLNTDAGATCDESTLCSDGTYLYVFWADDGSGDDGIHFRRVTLSDSTLYPSANDGLVTDLGSFVSIHQISAVCTTLTGHVIVSIPEEGAGPWRSITNGASWAEGADGDINTSDIFTTLIPLTGNKVMCVYDAGGNSDNDIKYKIYEAGWGVEGTLVNDIWTDNVDPAAAYRGNAVHIGSDEVIWTTVAPVASQPINAIAVFYFDGVDTWTRRNDYDTADIFSFAIPAYDEVNSKIYLYYDSDPGGPSSQPTYVTSIDKGINWSSATVIRAENGFWYGASINANSQERLGVVWQLFPSFDLRFEEIASIGDGAIMISKVSGLAVANIAKVNGVAAANIVKMQGLVWP